MSAIVAAGARWRAGAQIVSGTQTVVPTAPFRADRFRLLG
jgi:hypothetical protein